MSYTMADVSKALNANENSVGPYLSELAKDGKISKRGRGLYGANVEPDPDDEYERAREAAYEDAERI